MFSHKMFKQVPEVNRYQVPSYKLDKLSLSCVSHIVNLTTSLINCRRTSLVVRSCIQTLHCGEEESKLLLDKLSFSCLSLIVNLTTSLINCWRASLAACPWICSLHSRGKGSKLHPNPTKSKQKCNFRLPGHPYHLKVKKKSKKLLQETDIEAEWTQHWCVFRPKVK